MSKPSLAIGRLAIAYFGGLAAVMALLGLTLGAAELLSPGQAVAFGALGAVVSLSGLGVAAMLRRRLQAFERDVRNDVAVQSREILAQLALAARAQRQLETSLARGSFDPGRYWRDRAQHLGKLAVGDLGRIDRFDDDDKAEKTRLLPFLRTLLRGDEARALDFGCGFGRMTHELAHLVSTEAVGADMTPELLEIAERERRDPKVRFVSSAGSLPFPDGYFDLIWVSYVFIHILGDDKEKVARELTRVLAPGGLLFIVEGVTVWRTGSPHCEFRPFGWYQRAFPFLSAVTRHDLAPATVESLALLEREYQARNEDLFAVMFGRKP